MDANYQKHWSKPIDRSFADICKISSEWWEPFLPKTLRYYTYPFALPKSSTALDLNSPIDPKKDPKGIRVPSKQSLMTFQRHVDWWNSIVSCFLLRKRTTCATCPYGSSFLHPYANHGAGIFTYKTGSQKGTVNVGVYIPAPWVALGTRYFFHSTVNHWVFHYGKSWNYGPRRRARSWNSTHNSWRRGPGKMGSFRRPP